MKNTFYIIIFFLFVLIIPNHLTAQSLGGSLLPGGKDDSGKSSKTTITSNSMDINLPKDIITLQGNVKVVDKNNTIQADKMVVYLKQDKKKDEKGKDKKNKLKSSSSKENVKKIVATGNVVFTKHPKPKSSEEKESQKDKSEEKESKKDEKVKEQQALAGKAVYTVKEGKMILTKEPKLLQGNSYMAGDKIILWRDSNRMLVKGDQKGGKVSTLVVTPEQEKRLSK